MATRGPPVWSACGVCLCVLGQGTPNKILLMALEWVGPILLGGRGGPEWSGNPEKYPSRVNRPIALALLMLKGLLICLQPAALPIRIHSFTDQVQTVRPTDRPTKRGLQLYRCENLCQIIIGNNSSFGNFPLGVACQQSESACTAYMLSDNSCVLARQSGRQAGTHRRG